MGPVVRDLGPEVGRDPLWQDPWRGHLPAGRRGGRRRAQGADPRVRPAGAPARVHRVGGGLVVPGQRQARRRQRRRLRLEPQSGWEVNEPEQLATAPRTLEGIRQAFNGGGKQISMADLIVLARLHRRREGGQGRRLDVQVPFTPRCTDAAQEQTDVESFAALEPAADRTLPQLPRQGRPAGPPSTCCSTGRTC